MDIGIVIGNLVSTVKHSAYQGTKLLLVETLDLDFEPTGNVFVCVDSQMAGEGDIVLFAREGKTAGDVLGKKQVPVRSVIIGVVDSVQLELER